MVTTNQENWNVWISNLDFVNGMSDAGQWHRTLLIMSSSNNPAYSKDMMLQILFILHIIKCLPLFNSQSRLSFHYTINLFHHKCMTKHIWDRKNSFITGTLHKEFNSNPCVTVHIMKEQTNSHTYNQ